jgi:hypothetical protein
VTIVSLTPSSNNLTNDYASPMVMDVAQCDHGVALPAPFFYKLINFLISLCILTFNYSNNATPNKFICQKISRNTKINKLSFDK